MNSRLEKLEAPQPLGISTPNIPSPTPDEQPKTDIIPQDFPGIPFALWDRLSKIVQEGRCYGQLNWTKGKNSPTFRYERLSHAARHWHIYVHTQSFGAPPPDITPEEAQQDHLCKVLWYIMTEVHFQSFPKE